MEYEKENELNIQILIEQDQICSECFATLGRKFNSNIEIYEIFYYYCVKNLSHLMYFFCFLGPGKRHPCNKADTISNLKSILFSKGPRTTEQVLSTILKVPT